MYCLKNRKSDDTYFRNAIYVTRNKWCEEDAGSAVRVLGRNTQDGIRHAVYMYMKIRHRRQNVLRICAKFRKVTISLLDKDGQIGLAWPGGEVKTPWRVVGQKKKTSSFVVSVRPSVHMEQFVSHWRDFYENWYFKIFRKSD
jgi:hypothetical protein